MDDAASASASVDHADAGHLALSEGQTDADVDAVFKEHAARHGRSHGGLDARELALLSTSLKAVMRRGIPDHRRGWWWCLLSGGSGILASSPNVYVDVCRRVFGDIDIDAVDREVRGRRRRLARMIVASRPPASRAAAQLTRPALNRLHLNAAGVRAMSRAVPRRLQQPGRAVLSAGEQRTELSRQGVRLTTGCAAGVGSCRRWCPSCCTTCRRRRRTPACKASGYAGVYPGRGCKGSLR